MIKVFSGFIEKDYDGNIRLSDDYNCLAKRIADMAKLPSDNQDDLEDSNFYYMGGISGKIEKCNFSFYTSNKECSLEEAQTGFLNKLYGDIDVYGENYGYSEYTICGMDLVNFTIGNHDLESILESHLGKYIHIIIEF